MNISGVNTAIREIEIVRMVKLISAEPARAASSGASPASRRFQITSTMTIASSTTKPTAMVSAMSDRLSRLKPSGSITAMVASKASGITALGMSVASTWRRKRKMTATTSRMVMSRVVSTSLTEARMVWVRSARTWMVMAGGILACRPGNALVIAFTRLNDIRSGELVDDEENALAALQGGIRVGLPRKGPGAELIVLYILDGDAQIPDPDRGAVMIADDELIPRRHIQDLVVGVDREILQGPGERALGSIHGARDDLGADVVELQARAATLRGSIWMRTAGFCCPPRVTKPTPSISEIFCDRMTSA